MRSGRSQNRAGVPAGPATPAALPCATTSERPDASVPVAPALREGVFVEAREHPQQTGLVGQALPPPKSRKTPCTPTRGSWPTNIAYAPPRAPWAGATSSRRTPAPRPSRRARPGRRLDDRVDPAEVARCVRVAGLGIQTHVVGRTHPQGDTGTCVSRKTVPISSPFNSRSTISVFARALHRSGSASPVRSATPIPDCSSRPSFP